MGWLLMRKIFAAALFDEPIDKQATLGEFSTKSVEFGLLRADHGVDLIECLLLESDAFLQASHMGIGGGIVAHRVQRNLSGVMYQQNAHFSPFDAASPGLIHWNVRMFNSW